MGYAPFTEGAEKETYSQQDVGELQEDDVSEVYFRRIETKVLVSKEGDIFIIPFFERFCKVDRKKVLKSDHPTEFGKTSKKDKEKNTVHCHRREGGYLQRQRETVRKLLNESSSFVTFRAPDEEPH